MEITIDTTTAAFIGSLFLILQFLLIGIEKAFIEPIAKRFIQRKTIKYAPIAMNFLDKRMPEMMQKRATRQEMEDSLRDWLEEKTGESWGAKKDIDEMFSIYDARITADVNSK